MVVKMDKSSVATEKSRHTLYILHLKYAHLQSLLLYCQPPVGQWVSWPCPSVPQSHSANNKWVPLKIKSDKKELQKKNESIKTWMAGTHLHVVIKYIQKAIVFIIIWGGEGGTSQKHGAGVMKVKLLHRRRWRKLYIKKTSVSIFREADHPFLTCRQILHIPWGLVRSWDGRQRHP